MYRGINFLGVFSTMNEMLHQWQSWRFLMKTNVLGYPWNAITVNLYMASTWMRRTTLFSGSLSFVFFSDMSTYLLFWKVQKHNLYWCLILCVVQTTIDPIDVLPDEYFTEVKRHQQITYGVWYDFMTHMTFVKCGTDRKLFIDFLTS